MFQYVLKRIFIFIPTLIAISIVIFMLNQNSPGDPVEVMLNLQGGGEAGGNMNDKLAGEEAYLEMRERLNLHLPPFYFGISSRAYPDTLYRIPRKWHRDNLHRLVSMYGNWDKIEPYYQQLKQLETASFRIAKDSINPAALIAIRQTTGSLYTSYEDRDIQVSFRKLGENIASTASTAVLQEDFDELKTRYSAIVNEPARVKNRIPRMIWYGFNNQYHTWFTRFLRFDFGDSYQDKQPIASKIKDNIAVTMTISLISIILTYLIAVPLGVFSARNKGRFSDNVTTTSLFILYSLPNFWIATLMIIYLCQPQYLNWFPAYGLGEFREGMTFLEKLGMRAHHVILPLICWTYGSLAYLSRQMRGGMLNILSSDYIRTARAKGLEDNSVIWKHAFRNSLLPVITLFGNVFPLMISGSIVIEVIFSLPGMGKMLFDAIVFKDFPVVFTLVMMTAFLTMIGYLIVDILYALVDPRISYK
jgi:peptide/nickel transport system permease protein